MILWIVAASTQIFSFTFFLFCLFLIVCCFFQYFYEIEIIDYKIIVS